ncbi:MAG: acetate--CoA ligase family protein [Nitrososphaeria archaeon]
MRSQDIWYIFNPSSVAIIGASSKSGKIGHECFRSMISSGFKGKVYPVNPNAKEVLGVRAYSDIKEIPGDVDLVVYALPAREAVRIFQDFREKNVKSVIIVSGGFREMSKDGELLEEKILEIGKRSGFRVVGPNCVGVYDSYSGVDSLFQSATRLLRPRQGAISFISQSGTFAVSFMDWASDECVGVNKVVSVGNRADLDEADFIDYLNVDEKTDVIAVYVESYTNGRKFVEAVKRCRKAVVIYLAGRTRQGGLIAKSHTGRLASDYRIACGSLEGAGAILTHSFRQLFDSSKALAFLKKASGDRVLMITNGAGPCVVAADLMDEVGLKLAELQDSSVEALKNALPTYATIANPIDLTGSATSSDFLQAIQLCDDAVEVDIIALFVVFQDTPLEDGFVEELVTSKTRKPMLVFAAGGEYTRQKCRFLNANGIPTFQDVDSLVLSMKALVDVGKKLTG